MALLNKRPVPGLSVEVDTYENLFNWRVDKVRGLSGVGRRLIVQLSAFEPGKTVPFMHPTYQINVANDADLSEAAIYGLLKGLPDFANATDA